MGQGSRCAEFANMQDQNESCVDGPETPAETAPTQHGRAQTTIEDFYREGMGVAGKE